MDRLRALGYAVDAASGPGGGYQLGTGAVLPPLLLGDEEAVAVSAALRSATDTFSDLNVHDMHRAALRGDEASFRAALRVSLSTVPGAYEEHLSRYLWRCYAPLTRSPYRMERAYVSEVVRSIFEMKQHMMSKRSNPTPIPAGVLLLN